MITTGPLPYVGRPDGGSKDPPCVPGALGGSKDPPYVPGIIGGSEDSPYVRVIVRDWSSPYVGRVFRPGGHELRIGTVER